MKGGELLRVEGIQKFFATTQVLKNVDMDIRRGEVHALMGENGAGKSTLIKIITGAYTKDSGTIYFEGKPVEIHSRADAQNLKISCIYQELSVIPTLTVAQNIMLGREPHWKKLPYVDKRRMNQEVQALIDRYQFPLKASDSLEMLTVAQQQMVEILKALSRDSALIIMDEPTASLSGKESETLFSIIENLRDSGISVLYISHRLDEVYRLSDRLTVLRDGEKVAVLSKKDIVPENVIRLMIGKDLEDAANLGVMSPSEEPVVIKVEAMSRTGAFDNISFSARKGEILGFGGLVGSGRTEVMRCLVGADAFHEGRILINGNAYAPASIRTSIDNGICLVPEDRRAQGFVPQLSIKRNIALPNYDLLPKKLRAISDKNELSMSFETIKELDIRPSEPEKQVCVMSGGNQQKVVLGKWLRRNLNILIMDEPTAGIDVGAKEEIYRLMEALAASGVVVIVVSSDLQELIRVSTRILVMRKGSIVHEFREGKVSQDDVLKAASGLDMGRECNA